jgi:23S rRNA (adenine2030-N6)-methyltransferase
MNYRHIYHAGNFADVFKHAIFALVIEHLKKKEKPFFVLDTHAGGGRYDLTASEAARTGEYLDGVARLLAAEDVPADLAAYVGAIRRLNARYPQKARWYPGSPLLARLLARPGDRLAFTELNPEAARPLAREFGADPQVRVHHMDGYVALKALLPPPERRGVVLIDPPFEQKGEFAHMVEGLRQACRRFSTGIYLLWYPIKEAAAVTSFLQSVRGTGIRNVLAVELRIYASEEAERLNGCGLVMVNPPWTVPEALERFLPWMARLLAREGEGAWRLEWLSGE